MTLAEFKKNICREIRKWCKDLPKDGDFTGVELITDHWNDDGDGDYAVVCLVHNRKEAQSELHKR